MKTYKYLIIATTLTLCYWGAPQTGIAFGSENYCDSFNLSFDSTSHKGSIPQSWKDASMALLKALPEHAKKDFLANEGSFSSCFPNVISGKITKQITEFWRLKDKPNPLVESFNKKGFWENEEIVDLIIVGVYMIHIGETFDLNDPARQKFLQEQDSIASYSNDLPCKLNLNKIVEAGVVIGGYARYVRTALCENREPYQFLWERGWYRPSREDLEELCRPPVGDQKYICRLLNY